MNNNPEAELMACWNEQAAADLRKSINDYMKEDVFNFIQYGQEEANRLWKEKVAAGERQDQIDRCKWNISELKEKLDWEERSLAYLLSHG